MLFLNGYAQDDMVVQDGTFYVAIALVEREAEPFNNNINGLGYTALEARPYFYSGHRWWKFLGAAAKVARNKNRKKKQITRDYFKNSALLQKKAPEFGNPGGIIKKQQDIKYS